MTFLYLADISNVKINKIECLKNYISSYRYEKVSRYSNYKNKALSLASEVLLNYAITKQYPEIQIPVSYKKNNYGKPYFENNNIFFNISHSGNYAVCALSNQEIGIDIEKIRDINATGLSRKVFSDLEKKYFECSKNPIDDFFRIWTLKESYMKARGLGFKIGLKNFTIQIDKYIKVYEHGYKESYSFLEPQPPKGYKMAICQYGTIDSYKMEYVDINELLL